MVRSSRSTSRYSGSLELLIPGSCYTQGCLGCIPLALRVSAVRAAVAI